MSKFDLKKFFWENKEGFLIGGLAGFIFAKFFLPETFDFSTVQQTFGLIDFIKGTAEQTIEVAKTKVVWGFTILGTFIGALIDNYLPEGRWFK